MSNSINSTVNQSLPLYRLVFESRVIRLFVVAVMGMVIFQPALMVYANEAATTEGDAAVEAAVEETEKTEETEPVEQEIASDDEVVIEPPISQEEEKEVDDPIAEDIESVEGVQTSTTTDVVFDAETSTSTEVTVETGTSTSEVTTSESDSGNYAEAKTTQASSTEPKIESVTTNDSYFQFSHDDCVRVADGSYYCDQTSTERPVEDSFYVALDSDGDREIFAVMGGETYQITNNQYDDAAPHYDSVSDTLVWHALKSGRYQIMSYDFDTEETTQLTSGRANSMEPTRYDDVTVWQQWHNNNWEIVIMEDDETRIVTDNTIADIAPSVREDFIVWKQVYENEQVAVVYDITKDTVTTIEDQALGARVENARMVLVYEGQSPNGDRFVRGFDPRTQETMPIETIPASLPNELPDSEPTDEVRALVQQKPTQEEDVEEEPLEGNQSPTVLGTTTEALTNSETLIIPSPATTTSQSEIDNIEMVEPASATSTAEFELVIPPTATSTD